MYFQSFIAFFLVLQTSFAFRNFEDGKDYIFKFEWKKSLRTSTNSDETYRKISGLMYVRKINDTGVLFKFDKLKLDEMFMVHNRVEIEDLELPFEVQIENNEVKSLTTSGIWTSHGIDAKYELIRDFLKDYKKFLLIDSQDVSETVDLNLPFGQCKSTVKISNKGSKKEIKAKALKSDCIISSEFISRNLKIDGLYDPNSAISDDSENKIQIEVDQNEITEIEIFYKFDGDVDIKDFNFTKSDKKEYEFKRIENTPIDISFDDNLVYLNIFFLFKKYIK